MYIEVRIPGRINLLEAFNCSCAASHLDHGVVLKTMVCFLKKIIFGNQKLNLTCTDEPVRRLIDVY